MEFPIICVLLLVAGEFQGSFGMAVSNEDSNSTWLQDRDFTCTEDGLFPSATDCCSTMYYKCSNGVASEENCNGGTYFDPATKTCVRLAFATCGSPCEISTELPTTSLTTPGGGGFDCPTSNGFFPIPGTCGSDYYACVNGSPYFATCPNDTIFDPVLLICVVPENASCNVQFKCPENGFFPQPGQCSGSYYICVDDVATLTNCPGTSIFDPELLRCVPNGTASCQTGSTQSTTSSTPEQDTSTTEPTTTSITTESTTTSTTTEPTTTTTLAPPFSCPATGNYPYPEDCTLYYVCAGGSYIIAHCPPGQVFNPDESFCDSPASVPSCNSDPFFYRWIEYFKF